MPRNANQTLSALGGFNPKIKTMIQRVIAAMPTLNATKVRGGKSTSATSTKKNEPPQSTESNIKAPHTVRLIDEVIVDVIHKLLK
jgi:hypothetical protein